MLAAKESTLEVFEQVEGRYSVPDEAIEESFKHYKVKRLHNTDTLTGSTFASRKGIRLSGFRAVNYLGPYLGWFPSILANLSIDVLPGRHLRDNAPPRTIVIYEPDYALPVRVNTVWTWGLFREYLQAYVGEIWKVSGAKLSELPRTDTTPVGYGPSLAYVDLHGDVLDYYLLEKQELPLGRAIDLLKRVRRFTFPLLPLYLAQVEGELVNKPYHHRSLSRGQRAYMDGYEGVYEPGADNLKRLGRVMQAPMDRIIDDCKRSSEDAFELLQGDVFTAEERRMIVQLFKRHVEWALYAPARIEEVLVRLGAPDLVGTGLSFESFSELANEALLEFQQEL